MPPRYLTQANKACLTALQIWDTKLGPTSSSKVISSNVIVLTEIVDLLMDIIQAVQACLAAYKHQVPSTNDWIKDVIQSTTPLLQFKFPGSGVLGWPFAVVDTDQTFVAWNIPGAISLRLQKIAEDAVSALLDKVSDLLRELQQGIKNPYSSKFGCGIAKFSPSAMSRTQEKPGPTQALSDHPAPIIRFLEALEPVFCILSAINHIIITHQYLQMDQVQRQLSRKEKDTAQPWHTLVSSLCLPLLILRLVSNYSLPTRPYKAPSRDH
ncbi:hypothetical protein MD484_g9041, partial [Candolleomyces efflorescens]